MNVLAALIAHETDIAGRQHELQHMRRTIDDCRIDHRALAAGAYVHEGAEHADGEVQRTTGDITEGGEQ
ncbi:hypothetical protein D3C85_1656300 [compost metagenome]